MFAPRKIHGRGGPRAPLRQPGQRPPSPRSARRCWAARSRSTSLKYLKEDAKQKDAAAASRRRRTARSPKVQSEKAAARTKHRRRRSTPLLDADVGRQADEDLDDQLDAESPGRDEGGLRGLVRPRLRAQGALRPPRQDARRRQGLHRREAPGGGGAHQRRHRRAGRGLDARAPPRRTSQLVATLQPGAGRSRSPPAT